MPTIAFLLWSTVAATVLSSSSQDSSAFNNVSYFSDADHQNWVSFLNLRTALTRKHRLGHRRYGTLRVKAVITKKERTDQFVEQEKQSGRDSAPPHSIQGELSEHLPIGMTEKVSLGYSTVRPTTTTHEETSHQATTHQEHLTSTSSSTASIGTRNRVTVTGMKVTFRSKERELEDGSGLAAVPEGSGLDTVDQGKVKHVDDDDAYEYVYEEVEVVDDEGGEREIDVDGEEIQVKKTSGEGKEEMEQKKKDENMEENLLNQEMKETTLDEKKTDKHADETKKQDASPSKKKDDAKKPSSLYSSRESVEYEYVEAEEELVEAEIPLDKESVEGSGLDAYSAYSLDALHMPSTYNMTSKVVISTVGQPLDTRLIEKEELSIQVREEQIAQLRETLMDVSNLELDIVEESSDYGGSFVLPLLQKINYDNNTVPLIFNDIPVNVRTKLKIIHVGNFDSHEMQFNLDAELNMRWFDLRLANSYNRSIRLREKTLIDLVWRPDPYFVNSQFSYFHRVTFPNFRMKISPTGLVSYSMRVSLQPSCPMIFCRYPHDRQECDIKLSSIAYPKSAVSFSWNTNPYELEHELTQPELSVSDILHQECAVEGRLMQSSCLRLVFQLKREDSRFIIEKYIPSALAMMFSWVAPYVPYHYEDVRIVTPITVLLTLVQMEKGNQQVRTWYLTSIDVWFAAMKVFTVISLIESLVVLALIRRSRMMSKLSKRAANEYDRALLQGRRRRTKHMINMVDRTTQLASPIAFLSFVLYYVFYLTQGDEASCIQ